MNKKMMMGVMALLFVVSLFYTYEGIGMHSQVNVEEAKFHDLQNDYFSLDKQTRDSAPAKSPLNSQLAIIKNYPSELLRLKLVGVGKILTGIYILLFGILMALIMMPIRLGMIIKKK